ncbi:type IVB secretion system protein IcmH/DotU [Mesorhizobium sp. BHbsci]
MSIEESVLISRPPARLGAEEPSALPSPPPASDEPFWERLALHRLNPLVAAAAALLGLCAQLKSGASHCDVEGLRLRVLYEIDEFERRITPLRLSSQAIKISKYALCATIDDIILNTPWGSHSIWTTRSMVGSLFSETWGGDRFFDLLAQLKRDPAVNVDLLELLYYCMRLGFEGRFRVAARGATEHIVVCEDVYRLIRTARGDFERDLSPHWRGRHDESKPLRKFVPTWAVAALAAALLLSLYTGLLLALHARSDVVFDHLAALPPSGTVSLARIAPPHPIVMPVDRLRQFLAPEIGTGLITVAENAQQIVVTIRGSAMFDSASPTVKNPFVPLLMRIGRALNDQPGAILVTGHTDSMPISSPTFPSNHDLSLARAKIAGEIVKAAMNEPGRVREEGRGSTEPLTLNQTPEGRALNRRIEISVSKPN